MKFFDLTGVQLAEFQRMCTKILLHHGFFAVAHMKLDYRFTHDVQTAGTNGKFVFINPVWWFAMTEGERLYVALHEYMHCMLRHMFRMEGRDPDWWNIATDAIINCMLDEYARTCSSLSPIKRPAQGIFMSKYADWDAIATYNDLIKNAPPPPPGGRSGGKPGDKQGQGKGGQGTGQPQVMDRLMHPADGTSEEGGVTEEEARKMDEAWADALIVSSNVAKMNGNMPGAFTGLIADAVRPQLPWTRLYAKYFRDRWPEDSSWSKFNRRFLGSGTYLPGLDGQRIRKVVKLIDVSGSVSDAEIAVAIGGMNEVMEDLKPEQLWMVQWDTRVTETKCYAPEDFPLQAVEVKGRGGTDIEDAFRWVTENHPDTEVVTVLTDGCLNFPDAPPFDVIWLLTSPAEPPYGEVLNVRA